MRLIRLIRHVLIGATILLMTGGNVRAAACLSNGNGNWNATATWTGCAGGNGTPANTPGSSDTATIRNGHAVALTAAAAAQTVTITSAAGNNTTSQLSVAAQTLTIGAGGLSISGGAGNRVAELAVSAGTVTVGGSVGFSGTAANARVTFSGAGTLNVAGDFPSGGAFTASTGTVVFNSSANGAIGNYTYNNVTVSKTGAGAATTSTGTVTIGGALNVSTGTLNIAGSTVPVTGMTMVNGTLNITSTTGTKTFSGAVTVNGGGTWNNSANEDVTMGAGLSNGGTFTAGNGTYTLTGDLANSNIFNAGTGTFSLTGNFSNTGTFNVATGTFNFNGGVAQTLTGTASGTTTFANLTLNNANGLTLTGTHNATVSTLLTLTSGIFTTGANILAISNGSDISGAAATRFVNGILRKTVGAGGCTTCNFEIGSITGANRYTPVTNVAFTGITTGGTVSATTTAAEHPNVATSGLDDTLDVNRYWTLANSGVVFTSFNAVFNWVAADLDTSADTSIFEMQRYNPATPAAGTWNSTTTGTRTTTSISITGVTGFGDFVAGQSGAAAAGIGRFNAYDTTTAGGAVTGFITTKVSGTAFSVAVIAISNNRKSINTGYTGSLQVELLDASDNSGTLDTSTNCNTSWTLIQTLPNLVFDGSENGRKNMTVTENNSWRQARFRMTDGGLKGCSTDALAIRPASFAVSVTDADSVSAGPSPPGRILNNTIASGGPVHKAGRPFRITVTPSPVTATNYDGDPAVATGGLTCTLPGGCVNGTLTLGAFSGSGTRVSDTATYSEAGVFNLTLEDRFFAVIDASDGTPSDCSAAGRFICQSAAPAGVGRFVPDRFEFASPGTPTLLTFNDATCGTRSFTYVGQPFWYITGGRPSATVNAVDAGGTVTSNYTLDLASSKPAIGESYVDPSAPAAAPLNTASVGTPTLVSGAGTGTYMASLSGQLSYARSTTTPVGPFNAAISLTVTASDSTESGVGGNGTITTSTPLVFNGAGSGIAFDSGAQLRYGRLRLGNANGSQLVPLLVPMETQYWGFTNSPTNTILGFIANTADSCTAIAATNIELSNYTGNLNACETSLTVGAFSQGRANVLMSPPGAGNSGSVQLAGRLESSVVGATTCIGGVSTPVAGANRAYLQGNWTSPTLTENPLSRATFGAYRGSEEVIDVRENF